jgi:hypothetical protein
MGIRFLENSPLGKSALDKYTIWVKQGYMNVPSQSRCIFFTRTQINHVACTVCEVKQTTKNENKTIINMKPMHGK